MTNSIQTVRELNAFITAVRPASRLHLINKLTSHKIVIANKVAKLITDNHYIRL